MDRFIEFAANHPFLVSVAVFLTLLTLANEVRVATRRGVDLPPKDAVTLINQGAAVIDLRSFERFKSGHILGARHVPMEDLGDAAAKKLKALKDKPVIVYDDNGLKSARAVTMLRSLDFQRVANLKGGLGAWLRENYPLETRK